MDRSRPQLGPNIMGYWLTRLGISAMKSIVLIVAAALVSILYLMLYDQHPPGDDTDS